MIEIILYTKFLTYKDSTFPKDGIFGYSILVLLALLLSCSEESPVLPDIIEPNADYYFVGYIYGSEKRLLHNENDYTIATDVTSSGDYHAYSMSIYKMPLEKNNVGDVWVSITTPDVTNLDSSVLLELFRPGKLEIACSSSDYYKSWPISISQVTGKWYNEGAKKWNINKNVCCTHLGEQNGCRLEIISSQVLDEGTDYPVIKVKFAFQCKLYAQNGKFEGEIREGIFQGKLHLWRFF